MISLLFLLLISAFCQILGGFFTLIGLKKISKHHNLILIIEITIMILISGEIIFFSIKESINSLFGIFIGIAFIFFLNKYLPHKHIDKFEKLGFLVFMAMCLHEFPEGLSFGSIYLLNSRAGLLTGLLIALHNLPEGSILSLPYFLKRKNKQAFFLLIITQILYIAGGLASYLLLFSVSSKTQSFFTSIAAGLMLYIAFEELKFLKHAKKSASMKQNPPEGEI